MRNILKGKCLPMAVVFSFLLCSAAWARVTTSMDAMEVGENFISHIIQQEGSWGGATNAHIADCIEIKRKGKLLGYFLPVEPHGFIVVSLLTQLPPVKAFSTISNLDINDWGGMAALIKDTMEATIEALEEKYQRLESLPDTVSDTSQRNLDAWEWLLGNRTEPRRESDVTTGPLLQTNWSESELSEAMVKHASDTAQLADPTTGPLLSTTWGQAGVYNDYCPTGDTQCTECLGGGTPP